MKKSFVSCLLFICLVQVLLPFTSTQQQTQRGRNPPGRQVNRAEMDGKVSNTETVKMQQKAKYKQIQQKVHPQTQFKQFLFTLKGIEQFILNLPVAQQVAINFFTYIMVNDAYIRPERVEDDPPIKIFIIENNNRIVYNSQFHFQNYVVFDGLDDSTYTIRITNLGPEKLIMMNVKKITQVSHVDEVVKKEEANKHSQRTRLMNDQLKYALNGFQRYSTINFQAVKVLLSNINLYYYWQILQTIIAVAVCVIEMALIKNICKDQSIV